MLRFYRRTRVMIRAFDEDGKLPSVPYASMVFSSVLGTLFLRRRADKAHPIQDGSSQTFYPNWLRLSREASKRIGFSSHAVGFLRHVFTH